MQLDATDKRILTALQRKGRISNADLSEVVNLSPSACHRRVQRLEEEGYIRDYVALLNPRKMGVPTTVFVEINPGVDERGSWITILKSLSAKARKFVGDSISAFFTKAKYPQSNGAKSGSVHPPGTL